MKKFSGKVLFLDRNDINTDEIIPARYLTEVTKEALKPFLLEDLEMDGFDPTKDLDGKAVVVTRDNFGCGSSREHAPWAFEINDINVVIGEGYARIFRQNMFNCGMLAIDLDKKIIDSIFKNYANKETTISIDLDEDIIVIEADGKKEEIKFSISKFDKDLVVAGGWLNFADKNY